LITGEGSIQAEEQGGYSDSKSKESPLKV
jgi:hypothetical protein